MDWCVKEFSIDPAVSAMVGDRDSDVLAGKQHGMAGIGVSYGYGTEEELRESGADFICPLGGRAQAVSFGLRRNGNGLPHGAL